MTKNKELFYAISIVASWIGLFIFWWCKSQHIGYTLFPPYNPDYAGWVAVLAKRVANGEKVYSDFIPMFTPLSIYCAAWLSYAMQITPSIFIERVMNGLCAVGVGISTGFLGCKLMDRPFAHVLALSSAYIMLSRYDWLPYNTLSIFFVICSIMLYFYAIKSTLILNERILLTACGLSVGLTFLSKQSTGIGVIFALAFIEILRSLFASTRNIKKSITNLLIVYSGLLFVLISCLFLIGPDSFIRMIEYNVAKAGYYKGGFEPFLAIQSYNVLQFSLAGGMELFSIFIIYKVINDFKIHKTPLLSTNSLYIIIPIIGILSSFIFYIYSNNYLFVDDRSLSSVSFILNLLYFALVRLCHLIIAAHLIDYLFNKGHLLKTDFPIFCISLISFFSGICITVGRMPIDQPFPQVIIGLCLIFRQLYFAKNSQCKNLLVSLLFSIIVSGSLIINFVSPVGLGQTTAVNQQTLTSKSDFLNGMLIPNTTINKELDNVVKIFRDYRGDNATLLTIPEDPVFQDIVGLKRPKLLSAFIYSDTFHKDFLELEKQNILKNPADILLIYDDNVSFWAPGGSAAIEFKKFLNDSVIPNYYVYSGRYFNLGNIYLLK